MHFGQFRPVTVNLLAPRPSHEHERRSGEHRELHAFFDVRNRIEPFGQSDREVEQEGDDRDLRQH